MTAEGNTRDGRNDNCAEVMDHIKDLGWLIKTMARETRNIVCFSMIEIADGACRAVSHRCEDDCHEHKNTNDEEKEEEDQGCNVFQDKDDLACSLIESVIIVPHDKMSSKRWNSMKEKEMEEMSKTSPLLDKVEDEKEEEAAEDTTTGDSLLDSSLQSLEEITDTTAL